MALVRASRIDRLTLTGFRNYASLDIGFLKSLVALVGNNGAGKTNILEAISYLTAGRGLRRAALSDIARRGGDGSWAVTARTRQDGVDVALGTGFQPGEPGRRVRIDRVEQRSSEPLLDYIRILWLIPAMDGLFTGPGSDRRRFLDRLTLSLNPAHGRHVSAFEKALRQRNRLLEQGGNPAFLDALESQVAEFGTAVALSRRETVSLLSQTLADQDALGLPFPAATVGLSGPFEDETRHLAAADQEDRFRKVLKDGRGRDRAAGRTLAGPHLSDMAVRHITKDMPAAQSSTGEQKALLIGLILAHANLTASVTGMTPILLLDEVAAHLDPNRRSALFSRLHALGCQVFMTGTDEALFETLPATGEIFAIEENAARPIPAGHP
ncbi:DNA replication and repair protein RecF [Roseibium aquae]|uniref:DNA replication and repair protein RecF n=1 Tax=Roseibium aquae TaxID=1323746 RepID=A0A916TJC6_9HYPH|nr:DNA replication/repair protein RecF [Roseibium aquae]GGB48194.1 DNA replication and repair protein RecF [Roseibium aquae]